ncbi:2Fe-2S iron-sulfur cluster-binding protein [Falsirhodobacter xinxiangensis]|uniref:2Fe-2S iron-sulfur cluster-binding protein n=1 Tax=Falsirhodobacter xinxiangensis TaxID=2530049 RepID=UPI0010AABAF2|nr:hybrid-cluster NAD(P)-dependent oxidoreductase [Rhodobacter xinxiangensis]
MNVLTKPRLAFWTDAEELECTSFLKEAPNVMTFSFQSPSGALFNFDPGQFLTLELPTADGPVHRTYTISSSPSRPTSLTVTVKAQPDSIGTRWMFDNLRPGMRLKVRGPGGGFSMMNHPAAKYLFISAGSGITPMMSMTTFLYDSGRPSDIVFVNCAKRPSEIIFRERLEHMASRVTGIDLKWIVETTDPYQPWTGYRGFFNQLMLGLIAQDYLEREVFCCGPAPFMQAVRDALTGLGFDMDRYHQESFGGPLREVERVPDDVLPQDDATAVVTFAGSGKVAKCAQTDTILMVARAAGIPLATGCGMGICGTCIVQKTSGQVHMVHNGGITDEDVEAGYILACCSHPIGDVEIDL